MSLESQVAALVSAANNLTSQVAGKMSQIDQKVEQATQAVPETIKAYSQQSFYIDAEYGRDENDGSMGQPFKTIAGISGHVVNGSEVKVYLKAGQVHEVVGFGFNMSTGMVGFYSWGDLSAGNPKVIFSPIFSPSDNIYVGYVVGLSTGNILFRYVDVETNFDTSLGSLSTQSSFIAYTNSAISVIYHNGAIKLKSVPFIATFSGFSGRDLYLSSSTVEVGQGGNSNSKLVRNRNSTHHAFKLDVYNTQLLGGLTWRDLIDIYPDNRNILTNLDLSA